MRHVASGPAQLAQAVEVVLNKRAFIIKRWFTGVAEPKQKQVTWRKHGGVQNAWLEAMQRAGLCENWKGCM